MARSKKPRALAFEVWCKECGDTLEANFAVNFYADGDDGKMSIEVEPCKRCGDLAVQDALNMENR